MFMRFCSLIFGMGIGLAAAIPPVHAADEIEAKAQPCAACHGAKGAPADPKTVPVIWGQDQSYLMKQMRDFRNGERKSAIMSP
ncbi:MAG TPA: cytochrome C, partial [Bradyrhizobium sp.]|nr:cytochrome C [Bradyrhizobium sp.]